MIVKPGFLTCLFATLMISCNSSKYSETKYADIPVSRVKNMDGSYSRTFIRNGLAYYDTIKNNKLVKRRVYQHNELIYKYPVINTELSKTKISLASGKNYLQKNIDDTIILQNTGIPLMNRTVQINGAAISWLSDSTYLVRIIDNKSTTAIFFISVSENYEEIRNNKRFISDSLILPIK